MVAAGGVALLLVALAFAAHTRSAAGDPPYPAAPPCPAAADGSGVDCGPASAVIRVGDDWRVIDQGHCLDHRRLYFGAHGVNGDAPLSLMVEISAAVVARGGYARVVDGQLVLGSGAKRSLVGRAVIPPGGDGGAFSVHARADGKPTGTTYAGAWTCQAGHPAQQATSQQGRQAKPCTQDNPGADYGSPTGSGSNPVTCGRGSAAVLVNRRWQFVFPAEYCPALGPHFTSNKNRYLWFHPGSLIDQSVPNTLAQGVSDGEMTVAGVHAGLIGRVIFQPDQEGGGFDLNNRGGPSARWPRRDYVGAWTCAVP
jgi:hypothetical protein